MVLILYQHTFYHLSNLSFLQFNFWIVSVNKQLVQIFSFNGYNESNKCHQKSNLEYQITTAILCVFIPCRRSGVGGGGGIGVASDVRSSVLCLDVCIFVSGAEFL